jgi:hypothetical protein
MELYTTINSKVGGKMNKNNFNKAGNSNVIKETRDKFHHSFKVGFRAYPLGYKGLNLGITTTPSLLLAFRFVS